MELFQCLRNYGVNESFCFCILHDSINAWDQFTLIVVNDSRKVWDEFTVKVINLKKKKISEVNCFQADFWNKQTEFVV